MMTHLVEGLVPALGCAAAGIVVGAALAIGDVHAAERKVPVLPPAKVDYTRPRTTRQVVLCGDLHDVERRANTLMLEGWRAVPGMRLNDRDSAMLILEWRPGLLKGL